MRRLIASFLCKLLVVLLVVAPIADVALAQEPVRVVTITILLDRDDQNREAFRYMGNAIHSAVQKFQKEFGIKLVVKKMGNWIPGSNNFDADEELVRLISAGRSSDLVVAFTTKSFFKNEGAEIDGGSVTVEKDLGGLANNVPGNYAIVSLEEKSNLLLIHELGHLLGADHSKEPDSVMNGTGIRFSEFDQKSKEAIITNRNREF